MKCGGCGQEFPNLSALTKHKKEECPAGKQPEQKQDSPVVIPLALCPEEIKYYSLGKTVGLRVEGKYTPEGIEIQEVKLIR